MEGSRDAGNGGGLLVESKTMPPSSPPAKKHKVVHAPHRSKTTSSGLSGASASGDDGGQDASTTDTYAGATIFHRNDRPSVMPTQSFVIGSKKKPASSSSFDNRMSWKNIGGSLPRFPTVTSIPSMPSMPEMPNVPFTRSKDSTRKRESLAARGSLQSQAEEDQAFEEVERPATSSPEESRQESIPLKQRLADLHAKHPNLKDMSKPLLPIAVFPNQGTGKSSEFNQEAPIWARQPFKLLYFAYFGLSVGLVFLPWFAISSLFKSQRARPSWNWKRSTLVKLYRHGTRLTFRTYTSLSRDLSKEVPHSKTVRAKFVWVNGLPDELVRGEVRSTMKLQNIQPTRTCGFWYGERDGGGGVGQKASSGEKVIYHLHGGAYWIGTAHEKDVTSAVNMQVLRALDAIYDARLPDTVQQSQESGLRMDEETSNGPKSSPHPPDGGPAFRRRSGGHCKRAFSLDYRLCVPGQPEMGSYPAALLDALAGYRYLVQECGFACENIIVAGDSAGGNLALAMCRYLREEKMEKMPGAMILLSPWADASRSHSGPSESPNLFSTAYKNRDSDIISTSKAFRNTAVSALLGRLSAREAYRNPYLSSISLQLPPDKGGSGPNWGFEGFPRHIYLCTGSAEISHDQHLTLAYRLAGGTTLGRPIHSGDQLSKDADPFEMAARLAYPRPQDYEITLWPSAQGTPAGTPLEPPPGWGSAAVNGSANGSAHQSKGRKQLNHRLKNANGYHSQDSIEAAPSADDGIIKSDQQQADKDVDQKLQNQPISPSTDAAAANDTRYEAGKGPNTSQVKEKDTEGTANVTHEQNHIEQSDSSTPKESKAPSSRPNSASTTSSSRRFNRSKSQSLSSMKMDDIVEGQPSANNSSHRLAELSYFDLGRDDRTVVLDECRDAVHDYTLFNWYEPERGQTWTRIAKWIDEEV